MRRGFLPTLLAILACGWAVSNVGGAEAAEPQVGTVIGSGAVTGVYFATANAMCRLVARARAKDATTLAPCAATVTAGSIANVEALRSRSIDIGLVQSDILDEAIEGTGNFKDRPVGGLRVLFALYTEPFQLLVQKQIGVQAFADLKGRKINIGPAGTTQNSVFTQLINLHNMARASFSEVESLSAADQFAAFCEGNIEALGMVVGAPDAGFADAIARCGGTLVDVNSEAVRTMLSATPQYEATIIPAGTYPDVKADIRTFGVVAVAVARAEASDDQVYGFVKAVFDQVDALRAMHPALATLDENAMVSEGFTAPLHPGALRYFRERNLLPAAP